MAALLENYEHKNYYRRSRQRNDNYVRNSDANNSNNNVNSNYNNNRNNNK